MLGFTTLCWGGNAIFGQLAVGNVSPMLLVTLRWLGALTLLLIVAGKHLEKDWPALRGNLLFLFAMGATGFTIFNVLFYVAAYSTTALNVGIIQGAMPMIVLIGMFFCYGSRITGVQFLGVLVGLAGVCAVVSQGDFTRLLALSVNHGDLLMLLACVFYSAYAVGLRRAPQVSPFSLFTIMAGSALLVSLFFSVYEYFQGGLEWPTMQGWAVAGLITFFPSFLAQLFFIQGVSMIGAGRAGVFVNLVPVFAAILAVVILKEDFQIYHAVSLFLVLAGIALSEIGKPKGTS
ncbi:MAG: EamA family transporter [Gammaproteobacteria bacterium]|nr:EamA family transporter [Gammaproteobacteria bacterium]